MRECCRPLQYTVRSAPHWRIQHPNLAVCHCQSKRNQWIYTQLFYFQIAKSTRKLRLDSINHMISTSIETLLVLSLSLRSLSPTARHNIKCITMKLVVLSGEDGGNCWYEEYKVHENEDDWSKACSYIAKNVRLQNLAFSVHEAITEEFEDLAWVQDLVQIKGLSDVSQCEILGRPLEAPALDRREWTASHPV